MRIGEVQTRTWKDINWNNNDIYIHNNCDEKNHMSSEDTKNGKHRSVLLNKVFKIKKLKEKYAGDKKIDGFNDSCYIFGVYDVIYQQYFTRLKDKYIELYNSSHDVKLPRIVIHDFRHSHVSLLINNNVDSFTITERLGHSKEMVERVYGHMFPSKRKAILDVLDNL